VELVINLTIIWSRLQQQWRDIYTPCRHAAGNSASLSNIALGPPEIGLPPSPDAPTIRGQRCTAMTASFDDPGLQAVHLRVHPGYGGGGEELSGRA